MTTTEATNLTNALNNIAKVYLTNATIQNYIRSWKADVTGNANGNPSQADEGTGLDAGATPVSTVAGLASLTPTTGDLAIVTDSNTAIVGTTVAAGGSNNKLVKYSGAVWQIQ